MYKLDVLDRKILWELSRDGRRSVAQLARSLKQSRERVDYRLARLSERKILQRVVATVNPQRLGYGIYKTYLRVENNRPMVEKLIEHLRQHPRLAWFGVCDGSWDLAFCLYARSSKEFHQLYVQILSEFNPLVLSFAAYSLTHVRMYERNYFWRGVKQYTELGGDEPSVDLSALDWSLLNVLHHDGRVSTSHLSDKLGTSPATIASHIERLEREQVITGYRALINVERLGMLSAKTMLFLRNYEVELREEFLKFCDSYPFITCYTEQIGDCNLEIEAEVPSLEAYSNMMVEIRGRFAKLVRNFFTMMLRETAHHWLPRDLPSLNSALAGS